ncbi:phosphonate ABC transporter ATP-binding protein [Roseateles paludis]|uniref:ATP-binding cassette domain-containing protein n=1 Tax=Roseateles paludis TaxID=3145238 RepID=A0ABV0G3F8_9BURK
MRLTLDSLHARHPAAPKGRDALRGINLALQPGEQVAVIGPSGAGKTTLLHVAAAALKPALGTLQLDGTDPWQLRTAALQRLRSQLFLAPQVPPLPPRQRVVTAVLAGRLPAWGLLKSLRSLFYPADIGGAHAALDRFGLADKLFARVDRLSGGERQRVALARALVSPAKLWLVDEPLSALDPTRAETVIRTLTAEARERGVTMLVSMHQVDTALAHFSRILGLRDGAVAFDLPAADVSREHLLQLYAQHEDELHQPLASPDAPAAAPVVMHCR